MLASTTRSRGNNARAGEEKPGTITIAIALTERRRPCLLFPRHTQQIKGKSSIRWGRCVRRPRASVQGPDLAQLQHPSLCVVVLPWDNCLVAAAAARGAAGSTSTASSREAKSLDQSVASSLLLRGSARLSSGVPGQRLLLGTSAAGCGWRRYSHSCRCAPFSSPLRQERAPDEPGWGGRLRSLSLAH